MFWEEILTVERPEGIAYWPVANEGGHYVGMSSLDGSISEQRPFYSDQHPVDALNLMAKNNLDSVAVVNQEMELLGGLSSARLSRWMGAQWCFELPGSSVWLHASQTVSGSWIQALEEEGYRVVALATDYDAGALKFGTWIRLDQPDPTAAIETLERLGATVLGAYPPGRRHNDAQDNLDHLMHYLNL